MVLGEFNFGRFQVDALRLHEHPLDWLRNDGRGVCILDWAFDPITALSAAGRLEADSPQLKRRLERRIQQAALEPFDISVGEVSNAA